MKCLRLLTMIVFAVICNAIFWLRCRRIFCISNKMKINPQKIQSEQCSCVLLSSIVTNYLCWWFINQKTCIFNLVQATHIWNNLYKTWCEAKINPLGAVVYLYVRCIDFTSFYDVSIGLWFFFVAFHVIHRKLSNRIKCSF
jgi:hypothetical protein